MPYIITMRRPVLFVMILTAGLLLADCTRPKDAERRQPGQAFLTSEIPSGLAPQYYPPDGFAWGGYRAGNLPEARYGVASPPVNPRAQVLILADAGYPAEVWFGVTRQLLAQGYAVWLMEPAGQGGAGRYLLQGNRIDMADYRDPGRSADGLIRDLIRPTPARPLYLVGSGYAAITVMSLSMSLKGPAYAGFVAYDPYLGGEIAPGGLWHRQNLLPGDWGVIAQSWQSQNPDLRLRMKSDNWRKQTMKAFSTVAGLHMPVLKTGAPVTAFEPATATPQQVSAVRTLCAHVPRCRLRTSQGEQAFGAELLGIL